VLADCRLYDAAGEVIAAVEGVRFQAASLKRPAASVSFIAERRVLKPVGAPAPLPPIEQLAAAGRARLHAAARMQARERYFSEVEPLLEAMLGAFAARALADAGELPAERRALAERLREFAAGGEFPDGREIWRQLLRDHPDHAEEIIWLGGIGLRLPEMLRGAAERAPPRRPAASSRRRSPTCSPRRCARCRPDGGCACSSSTPAPRRDSDGSWRSSTRRAANASCSVRASGSPMSRARLPRATRRRASASPISSSRGSSGPWS
jgi:hypothetical protein